MNGVALRFFSLVMLAMILPRSCFEDEKDPKVRLQFSKEGPKWESVFSTPTDATLKAKEDFAVRYFGVPNWSTGKFVAQVTVSYLKTLGLTDHKSRGVFRLYRVDNDLNDTGVSLSAIYDAVQDGLIAQSSTSDTTATPFAGAHALDVRIEQTDTQLLLSARKTPALGSPPDAWTPVATIAEPLTDKRYKILVGIVDVDKGGSFHFSDLRMNGDAVGGAVEYTVIAKCEAADDAIRAAQEKLALAAPDFAGASADLDTAATETGAATSTLNDAVQASTLQGTTQSGGALTLLDQAAQKIAAVKSAIATQNVRKAHAQNKPLNLVAGAEEGAIANLLGAKTPNLKPLPQLFTWHVN
ncbi:MAG: hypothetical protein QOD99_224 [Chthoniobacter sp.]|jgi:hypothetical protein|nr:hypothetical protein [Chthoniobacter sp.]